MTSTDQDAKRWQTLVKALDQNHLKGPGYGDRVRVVMTSPMFGFEEKLTATELQIRLDAIIKEEIMKFNKYTEEYEAAMPDLLGRVFTAITNTDEVMANQADLVEVVHTLKQVLCVKGA